MKKLGLGVLFVFFVASVATADLTWYTDQGQFEAACNAAGLPFDEFEDFEESTMGPNQVLGIDDPLYFGLARPMYPNGLTGISDMQYQSNILGGAPAVPNPAGLNGIALASVGFLGATSDVAISNTFVNSMDMDFDEGAEKRAVGFNTLDFMGGNQVQVRAYGVGEVFLGMSTVGANPGGNLFVGVIATPEQVIGRINVFSPGNGAEGGDNIQTWIPEPASLVLLALGGLLIRRR